MILTRIMCEWLIVFNFYTYYFFRGKYTNLAIVHK